MPRCKANECQVMIAPNPADLDAMGKNPDIQLLQQAGLNIGYMAMNAQKPPFDKVEVRQAIAMAIDRDAILKEVYQGAGQKAKNPIPPTMWSYDDSTVDYRLQSRQGQGNADGRRRRQRSTPTCGGCRCSAPTTPMPSAWPK